MYDVLQPRGCYRCRDDALSELATAYADIDAMQATLADSAVYVRQLRKKVIDLELQQCAHRARAGQARDQDEGEARKLHSSV